MGHARVHCNWRLPAFRDFDVIVCNTLMSLTGQWIMRRAPRKARWMFWGEKLGPSSGIHDTLTAPLHRASGIAAIGSWAERDYSSRFPHTRVFNIPYHCDLTGFRAASDRKGTTFLFCGQMIARKGLDLLLAAFETLPSNVRLLLVGREAELPQMLGKLSDSTRQRIEYAGFQPPEALPAFFARSDVFVLPSRHDGWGVVVNQALGAGLPIVASDQVGAARDLVTPGFNGEIFRDGDVADLAARMKTLAESPELQRQWGAASRERSHDWDPEDGAERWLRALNTITS